jgi:hypothetical protein
MTVNPQLFTSIYPISPEVESIAIRPFSLNEWTTDIVYTANGETFYTKFRTSPELLTLITAQEVSA